MINGLIFASIILAACNADTANDNSQMETKANFMAAKTGWDPITR